MYIIYFFYKKGRGKRESWWVYGLKGYVNRKKGSIILVAIIMEIII